MMFRKWIFSGLMILLGAVLVGMVLKSRQQERRQQEQQRAQQPVFEIIQQSKPTPTRVLTPTDIEIFGCKIEGSTSSGTSHATVSVRNRSSVDFSSMEVEFSYFDPVGKKIATVRSSVSVAMPAGQTVPVDNVNTSDIPMNAVRCSARVLYAQLTK